MSAKTTWMAVSLIVFAFTPVCGQLSEGENVTLWQQCDRFGYLEDADTLWMGGVFLRVTAKPLTIRLKGSSAGQKGLLYMMVPGHQDSAYYIFSNKDRPGTSVDLNAFDIPQMDTNYFMYAIIGRREDGLWDTDPADWRSLDVNRLRYTGPNRRAGDGPAEGAPPGGWLGTDRYSSEVLYNSSDVPCNSYPNYRRFAVAEWVQQDDGEGGRVRTDTVAFGFEHGIIGDGDFDDIVFYLTGVFLNRPNIVNEVRLTAEPSNRVIPAGDSVVFTAEVLLDSVGEDGRHYTVSRPEYNAQVTWQVSGPSDPLNPGLRYGTGPRGTNTFYGRRAYQTYTVIATFVDELGNVQSAELEVTVNPGPVDHLYIEDSPDSSAASF